MTPSLHSNTSTTPTPQRLLTPADVTHYCHISSKTVLRAIRAGRLRASRLGQRGAYRIRIEDVHAWIAATTVSAERASEPSPRSHRVDQRAVGVRRGSTLSPAGRLVLTDVMGPQR